MLDMRAKLLRLFMCPICHNLADAVRHGCRLPILSDAPKGIAVTAKHFSCASHIWHHAGDAPSACLEERRAEALRARREAKDVRL